jgi:murein DD-endopeptidase MepM/ murein hydrolase activator NlpD
MLLGSGRRPVVKTSLAAALLGVAAGAPAAQAQPGGATASSSAPSVDSVTCRGGCADPETVQPGGLVTLRGTDLDRAGAVVFLGGRGSKDDVLVPVSSRDARRLDVKVPAKARSGRVAAVTDAGSASAQGRGATIRIGRKSGALTTLSSPTPVLAPVRGLDGLDAGVATRKSGKVASGATVAYVSRAAAPVAVRLDVVRVVDGLSVFTDERTADPQAQQTVAWDGKAETGIALDGKYEVRLSTGPVAETPSEAPATANPLASGGAGLGGAAPQGAPPPPGSARVAAFTFASAVFPVQGTHNYGQSGARFGAGRSGHSHEGQDVMARCGTPVVAARGGVVAQSTYHSAAGNYVVIDDPVTGESHAYMHFREPAAVARGDTVGTGQQIGVVGSTGSSTACHLHFEIWTTPGWYRGGTPIDPLATLKRWGKLT